MSPVKPYRSFSFLCLLLPLAVSACGDDSDADAVVDPTDADSAGPSASTGEPDDGSTGADPFASCDRSVLETDLMGADAMGNPVPLQWVGPGVDPDTGELLDDGSRYVVSTTYLALSPTAEGQMRFGELMGPITAALQQSPGLVAMQLGTSMECATARTFTVWEDEAAMMQFVMGDAHGAAVSAVGEVSRGGSVVTSWGDAPVSDIDWDQAVQRIAEDEGPFY